MAYVDYEDFYKYVLPEVHGCPKVMAKDAIRNSIIEFCAKSRLWVAPTEDTDILAGYSRYSFDARDDAAIVHNLIYAAIEDVPLDIVSEQELDQASSTWRTSTSTSPTKIYMDTNYSVRLVGEPTEDIDNGLYLEVVLKPSRSSDQCPDFILENWAETIAHGALARLKAMVGRVWADAQTVSYHRSEFRAGVSRAKGAYQKSRQTKSATMGAQTFLGL